MPSMRHVSAMGRTLNRLKLADNGRTREQAVVHSQNDTASLVRPKADLAAAC
jgi:hypothetical protein